MIAQLLFLASSCPAVRLHEPAYPTAPDIVLVAERGGGGVREFEMWEEGWGGLWGGGVERYECRRKRQKSPRGKSASINNQVTPGALQLLELPQRDVNVSGIALVKLRLPKPLKNRREKKRIPCFFKSSESAKMCFFVFC